MAAANRPDVLAVVESFLGARPTLSDLRLWWSYPRAAGRESQPLADQEQQRLDLEHLGHVTHADLRQLTAVRGTGLAPDERARHPAGPARGRGRDLATIA